MLSLGTLSARASRMALASLRFMSGLPPPSLAEIWMARQSLDQSLPRRASAAPFLCLMVAQWECPDMSPVYRAPPGESNPAAPHKTSWLLCVIWSGHLTHKVTRLFCVLGFSQSGSVRFGTGADSCAKMEGSIS